MGVKDMLSRFSGSSDGAAQKPFKGAPPVPHATRPGGAPSSSGQPAAHGGKPFVIVNKGQLMLEDGTSFRFASLNAPELLDGHEFEVEDTMRTLVGFGRRVTRTYTLKISGTSPHFGDSAHISGWDQNRGDWIYDEGKFQRMDKVIALAEKYDVRLIIPVLNQDFGSVNNNWVGNFVDLVRHRKNTNWNYATARDSVDFFTDREMIESTKLIFTYLLNRVNTITGKRYGDDPTVLAWETGNELQYKGKHPAPGDWTVEIARHIRSLSSKTLIMDGSFAKAETVDKSYASEVLKCKEVELLSYHYYGTGDSTRAKKDASLARKHGKVFIAGEFGFLDSTNDYAYFLSAAEKEGCGGSLVWSLRPHSASGGFKTHREDESNSAYHVPGWPSPVTPQGFSMPKNWDAQEHQIVQYIRHASFSINGEAVPQNYPVPNAPYVWSSGNGSISWRGATWANTYEVWLAPSGQASQEQWQCIAQGILDVAEEGKCGFSFQHPPPPGSMVMMRGVGLDGVVGEWSNAVKL